MTALHSKLKVHMECAHSQVDGRIPVDILCMVLKESGAGRLEMVNVLIL